MTVIGPTDLSSYPPTTENTVWEKLCNSSFRQWNKIGTSPENILNLFQNYGHLSCPYTLIQHRFLLWSSTLTPEFKSRVDDVVKNIFNPKYYEFITDPSYDPPLDTFNDLSTDEKIAMTHIACTLGRTEFIQIHKDQILPLLGRANYFGGSAFHSAISGRHFSTMTELVKLSPSFISESNRLDMHPIHSAALRGDMEMLEFLLNQLPALSSTAYNRDGLCIIHLAVINGNLELIKWLAARSEHEIRVKTKDGRQAIHLAVEKRQTAIVNYLLTVDPSLAFEKDKNGNQLIHYAAMHDNLGLLHKLLEKTPLLRETRNNEGFNALLLAAKYNKIAIFIHLAQTYGQLLETYNENGELCTHLAALGGHVEILKTIMDLKIPDLLDIASREGLLPIHIAAQRGKLTIFKKLSKRNPNSVLAITSTGVSSIFLALQNNRTYVVRYILKEYPDVLATRNREELSPFELALMNSNPSTIMSMLIAYMAYLWKNKDKEIPFILNKDLPEEKLSNLINSLKMEQVTLSENLKYPPYDFDKVVKNLEYFNFYITLRDHLFRGLKEQVSYFGKTSKIQTTPYKQLLKIDHATHLRSLLDHIDIVYQSELNSRLAHDVAIQRLQTFQKGLQMLTDHLPIKSKTTLKIMAKLKANIEALLQKE